MESLTECGIDLGMEGLNYTKNEFVVDTPDYTMLF